MYGQKQEESFKRRAITTALTSTIKRITKMNDTRDAVKMMSEGFEMLSKGFSEMVKRMEAEKTPATPAKAKGDADTRTVTLPEAAKRLGVSRSTIDRLCEAGQLEFVKDRRTGYRRITVAGILTYHRQLHEDAKRMKKAA